jgi:hypothetical protein
VGRWGCPGEKLPHSPDQVEWLASIGGTPGIVEEMTGWVDGMVFRIRSAKEIQSHLLLEIVSEHSLRARKQCKRDVRSPVAVRPAARTAGRGNGRNGSNNRKG